MFKSLFFRFCYRMGFYPVKIRSPEQTYAFLKAKPAVLKEDELQKLSYAVALSKDQKYYTQLLKKFVPNWKEESIEESTFIGEGYGRSSLNAYRKVRISGKYFFEKVYFPTHPDLQKLQEMEKLRLATSLAEEITLPRIKKSYSGELNIVYFDFLKFDKTGQAEEKELIHLTKTLYRKSEEWLKKTETSAVLQDFTQHHQYGKFWASAMENLQKEDIQLKELEQQARTTKHVLTHGDLQKTNFFKPDIVMDWDSFGVYPIGFDPAFLFFRLVFKEGKKENPGSWLKENYQLTVDEQEWKDFERNFIYFLFIFAQELFLEQKEKNLKNFLVNKLKSYRSSN